MQKPRRLLSRKWKNEREHFGSDKWIQHHKKPKYSAPKYMGRNGKNTSPREKKKEEGNTGIYLVGKKGARGEIWAC